MKLVVSTPTALVVEVAGVTHIRAEELSGGFGILPGHADFLTVLAPSVLTWRTAAGEGHVVVRGGVLTVAERGQLVRVATREAVAAADLHGLETDVVRRFADEQERERQARAQTARLQVAAVRRIEGYLHPGPQRHDQQR